MLEFFVLVHIVQEEVATRGIALVVKVGEMSGKAGAVGGNSGKCLVWLVCEEQWIFPYPSEFNQCLYAIVLQATLKQS